jgi:hypothetical protein
MSTQDTPGPISQRFTLNSTINTGTIYICAAIGGFIAAVADLVQKEEASAVEKITKVSARHLELTVQPLWTLSLLVILAAALCFVFQPKDRKQSFGVGVGIIAAIMTLTPYKGPLTGAPIDPPAVTDPAESYYAPAMVHRVSDKGGFLSGSKRSGKNSLTEGQLAFTVSNATSDEAVIAASIFVGSRDYYQKYIANPGSDVTFAFQLPPNVRGQKVSYALEVNGKRLPNRTLTPGADGFAVSAEIRSDMTTVQEFDGSDVEEYSTKRNVNGSFTRKLQDKLFNNYRW